MKTAVEIAIQNVDQCLNAEDVKSMLGELLEMEKQQIINAFSWNVYGEDNRRDGKIYYNETFKNTEK
jgi:hypothetical protein